MRSVDPALSRYRSVFRLPPLCGIAFICLAGLTVQAQESIRPSSTGAAAAEARQGTIEPTHYNIKAGPVTMNATATMGVEFNDNIGLSENHRESDFIFRPSVQLATEWKVSQLNTLRISLGIGFEKYASHSDLDTQALLLNPGSEVSFDVYIGGKVRLNFHDRFSIVQNPTDEVTLSNTARFDRFENSVGVTAYVDLNTIDLVLGYDHFDYLSLGSQFDYLNRREEQFMASAGYRVNDALRVGVEGTFAIVDYNQDFNNDGTTWSGGVFADMALSSYTKVRVNTGYQGMSFDSGGGNGDHSDFEGWYASVTAAQRINQYWSHSISLGHEARLGLSVNFVDYSYARYVMDWRVNTHVNLGIEGFIEDAEESDTNLNSSEKALRWGAGASLSWRLSSRLSLGLRYRYVHKNSDLALRSYYQNVGTVTLNYDF